MKWTLILKAKKIVFLDEFQGGIFRGNKKNRKSAINEEVIVILKGWTN